MDAMRLDEVGVREQLVGAALDYLDGWFDGDVDRMRRALHPSLAKRSPGPDGELDELSAAWLVGATAEGRGRSRDVPDRAIDVEVVDVHGDIAAVVVRSAVYREYLHLVRDQAGWRIINVLWAWT
ncbi:MAG: nuclear transport factor 2 family protein [Sporichthyaceae bacterium]|nr:nuclear transport factor 2 family protein [Sporichthyaceae bacterium]